MRNVTIAGIAGAIGGALVSWLIASRVAEPRDPGELSGVLRELRESIVLLRASLDAGSPARATLSTTEPKAAPPLPPREAGSSMAPEASPDPRSTPPAGATRASGRTALPAPDRAAVAEMSAWPAEENSGGESDPAREKGVRRRWLFATQDEVLAAFGTPDQISGHADEERWHYSQFKDGQRESDVMLIFWNGRLRKVY